VLLELVDIALICMRGDGEDDATSALKDAADGSGGLDVVSAVDDPLGGEFALKKLGDVTDVLRNCADFSAVVAAERRDRETDMASAEDSNSLIFELWNG
jgi:hypothetical protein